MAKSLTALGIADSAALAKIQDEIQREVDVAVKFAIDAPYPAADKVDHDVYA
jgi:TPP-dependent pyruvate/acetoin dehydrogenase alpha subunit